MDDLSRKSKKELRVFGWASFLNDFGSDMIFPLWPVFLQTVLGANMTVIGLLDGLGEAMVSISQAVSGHISDKIKKRKPFIWIGYLAAGVARIGYAVAPVWQAVIPFRILDRAGKMRGAPRDAIIADISTDADRGKNFGFLRMMDNAGAVCGVIFAIIFLNYLGYTKLFLIAAVPSLASALLVLRFVKEKQFVPRARQQILVKKWDKNFILYLVLACIFSLATFSYSFLLLAAARRGFAVITLPILYLVYTAVATLTSSFFGKLSDRIGRKPVLGFAFLAWIGVCLIFVFLPREFGPLGIVAAFILYGLHLGALDPTERALVSELVPDEQRARGLGFFQMATGLFALPSSLIAGLLWDHIGSTTPFLVSAGMTLCVILCIGFVKRIQPHRPQQTPKS